MEEAKQTPEQELEEAIAKYLLASSFQKDLVHGIRIGFSSIMRKLTELEQKLDKG